MAAGEELGVALLLALAVFLGGLRAPITLVALHGALGRLINLGLVGTSDAQALSLASYIGIVAPCSARLLALERGEGAGGGGSILGKGKDADGQREDNSGVLHVDRWIR